MNKLNVFIVFLMATIIISIILTIVNSINAYNRITSNAQATVIKVKSEDLNELKELKTQQKEITKKLRNAEKSLLTKYGYKGYTGYYINLDSHPDIEISEDNQYIIIKSTTVYSFIQ